MKKNLSLTFFLICFFIIGPRVYAKSDCADLLNEKPFWQKEPLYRSMVDERKIYVSSRYIKENDKCQFWSFKGAGVVRASIDKTWKAVFEFDRLKKISDVFKSVIYDETQKKLNIKIKLLAIEKELVLRFKTDEFLKDKKKLFFVIETGFMTNLDGELVIQSMSANNFTEVNIFAKYPSSIEKWPDWVFAFATEAVMSRVAGELRIMVESQDI